MISFLNLLKERSPFFFELLTEHIILTAIAVSIISILGLALGILMSRRKKVASLILPVINFIYTIPSIALLGLLVTLTGIGDTSAVVALVIYGLLPMTRSVYLGLTEVDRDVIEAAEAMGSTDGQMLMRIRLPLALPVIFSGFRTMVIMTIALGAIASFIGAGGLGVAIYRGISTYFPEMIVAGSLLTALLAVFTDLILGTIEKGVKSRYPGLSRK